jgi:ABC-type lipoprotein release transport system permease subunit
MEIAQTFFIGAVGATIGLTLGVFITMAAYRKNK